MRLLALAVALLIGIAPGLRAARAGTLDDIHQRDHILCGVAADRPGLSVVSSTGVWSGLDTDYCAALAAAVLGSRDKVKFVAIAPGDRFSALKSGVVDLLSGATTWTLSRDTEVGLRFAGVLYYDGQAFLTRRSEAVASVLELSGTSICVQTNTAAEQGLADFFRQRQMKYQPVVAERWSDLVKAYGTGSCTLITGDQSALALERSRMARPAEHIILPELIAKDPLGPVVRQGDEEWFQVVRWTLMGLIAAEELGVLSTNVDAMATSPSVETRTLLGSEGSLGPGMGLPPDWGRQMIRQVGNYGEMFERNLGARSELRIERGLNALWSKGGIMYAAPIR